MASVSGLGGRGCGIEGMLAQAKQDASPDALKSKFEDMIQKSKKEAAEEIDAKNKKSEQMFQDGEHLNSIMLPSSTSDASAAPATPMAPMPNL